MADVRRRARLLLTSDGKVGPASRIEVITEHGAVIDISHLVQGASWSISYDDRPLVTLRIRGAEVNIVDPPPEKDPANEGPAEVLRSLAMARRDGRLDEALRDALALYGVSP